MRNFPGLFVLSKFRLAAVGLVASANIALLGAWPPATDTHVAPAQAAKLKLAEFLPVAIPTAQTAPVAAAAPAVTPVSPATPAAPPEVPELVGSIGYAVAGGNCVNEPGVNNPGYGNPSAWPITSIEPWIGATAVFNYDHVGVVTGIWRNGDVEVRHQNYYGSQHRFPRSTFRGFR